MGNYNYLVAIIILLFVIGVIKKSFLISIIEAIFGFWDKLPSKFKVSIGVVEIPTFLITAFICLVYKNLASDLKEVFIYIILPNIAGIIINIILPSFKNIKL